MRLASIEGDEVVIRFPVASVETAAPIAWERRYGAHRLRISDAKAFAKDLVRELNREEENGDTVVLLMLDRAVCKATEDGAEGVEEGDVLCPKCLGDGVVPAPEGGAQNCDCQNPLTTPQAA